MSAWVLWGNTNHQSYLDWLAQVEREQIQTGRFKTKKGYWIVKRSRQIYLSLEASCRPIHTDCLCKEEWYFWLWVSPVDACLGMYDCISLISGYWAICLWRSTERVRNVSPSRLTSVLATVLCLVLGVGFCCWLVFSCFGASCLVVFLSSLVHHTLRHT